MSRLTYIEQPCKSVLNRVEGMPFKWSINPYTGCAHACRYCYARAFYMKADRGTAEEFDRQIYVKVNAPEVLRTELARRSWKRELVVVGAATDPYQPGEARFAITRSILEALRDYRTPVSLITKGPLILRDLELLRQVDQAAGVEVHITIPTLDERAWRSLEPRTPPPSARLAAVRRLNAAGIRTGVFLAPILPGISDDERSLRSLLEAAREAGAPYVVPITLRLAPGVREWFLPHISQHFPHLTLPYCRLYQKVEARPDYKARTLGLAASLLQELGLASSPGEMRRPPASAPEVQQLRLSI
ncbi:MAG: radical SAM protein [Bacillota bacterium]